MARIRACKPEEGLDEDLQRLSWPARYAWHLLWCHADKAGRLEDRPKKIKAQILPYDDGVDFAEVLEEFARAGFIVRYAVGDKRYIQIRSFEKHQRPHHTEPESTLPPMQEGNIGSAPQNNGVATVVSPCPDGDAPALYGEGKGKGKGKVQGSLFALEFLEQFWPKYPRKESKADAEKAFVKARGKVDLETMLAALERQKPKWTDPKFIPHAATWLNGERWLDEAPSAKPRDQSPAEQHAARVAAYLEVLKKGQTPYWNPDWGPKPESEAA